MALLDIIRYVNSPQVWRRDEAEYGRQKLIFANVSFHRRSSQTFPVHEALLLFASRKQRVIQVPSGQNITKIGENRIETLLNKIIQLSFPLRNLASGGS